MRQPFARRKRRVQRALEFFTPAVRNEFVKQGIEIAARILGAEPTSLPPDLEFRTSSTIREEIAAYRKGSPKRWASIAALRLVSIGAKVQMERSRPRAGASSSSAQVEGELVRAQKAHAVVTSELARVQNLYASLRTQHDALCRVTADALRALAPGGPWQDPNDLPDAARQVRSDLETTTSELQSTRIRLSETDLKRQRLEEDLRRKEDAARAAARALAEVNIRVPNAEQGIEAINAELMRVASEARQARGWAPTDLAASIRPFIAFHASATNADLQLLRSDLSLWLDRDVQHGRRQYALFAPFARVLLLLLDEAMKSNDAALIETVRATAAQFANIEADSTQFLGGRPPEEWGFTTDAIAVAALGRPGSVKEVERACTELRMAGISDFFDAWLAEIEKVEMTSAAGQRTAGALARVELALLALPSVQKYARRGLG